MHLREKVGQMRETKFSRSLPRELPRSQSSSFKRESYRAEQLTRLIVARRFHLRARTLQTEYEQTLNGHFVGNEVSREKTFLYISDSMYYVKSVCLQTRPTEPIASVKTKGKKEKQLEL